MIDQWQEGELVTFEIDENGEGNRIIFPGYSLIKTK
jgi:hypothetical protein